MFSVIICTYNRDRYLYNVLQSIAENRFPRDRYEIVLVDNNSTDHTREECGRFRQDYPEVVFRYFTETRQGLSFARNRGIEEARGDMLIFLDDDAFIPQDYLSKLTAHLAARPDLQAFGGRITPRFESGVTPPWYAPLTASFVSALDKGDQVKRFGKKSYPIGANMGMYKRCLAQTGCFDTTLGRNKGNLMGGEEKDLFNRFKQQGFPIYYLPDVRAEHVIPESRTTYDYIGRLGLGVGRSERRRTRIVSRSRYLRCLVSEAFKWCATLAICLIYTLSLHPARGKALLLFRRNVTRGLLTKNDEQ